MNPNQEPLSARDVDMIIAGWEAMKPREPRVPEPLFVWPTFFGFRYFLRLWKWKRKMKATWWWFFHEQYRTWMTMITRHYALLASDLDRERDKHPQLLRLWDYQSLAQKRLRENSISQLEFNRRKANCH